MQAAPTARVEAAIRRFKRVIGNGLHVRMDRRRATETQFTIDVLSRMLELGFLDYTRVAWTQTEITAATLPAHAARYVLN